MWFIWAKSVFLSMVVSDLDSAGLTLFVEDGSWDQADEQAHGHHAQQNLQPPLLPGRVQTTCGAAAVEESHLQIEIWEWAWWCQCSKVREYRQMLSSCMETSLELLSHLLFYPSHPRFPSSTFTYMKLLFWEKLE